MALTDGLSPLILLAVLGRHSKQMPDKSASCIGRKAPRAQGLVLPGRGVKLSLVYLPKEIFIEVLPIC